MFQKNAMPERQPNHEPETVIAASVKVEGDFVSQGNVLIEGVVEGSLRTERDLRVGERARIDADVSAANATVAGEIRGNLAVAERLELEPTARIYGDVKTKVLVVASGASVNGRIAMGAEHAPEEKPAKASRSSAAERAKDASAAEKAAEADEEKEKARTVNALFGR
jgi:cytoskeletal protein CcmA (bactofilin family)